MIKLSVVIITFNEEKNIARCLASVKNVADDIVVVDSFSKDKTKEICLAAGVRFVEHTFAGHIQQKNWAITQAKYPHVLSLDADEALDETLQKSIIAAKQNWQHDGYYMNRLTNYCGHWVKHCGWYPDKKLRLWDSTKGEWRGTNPHDKYEMFQGDKTTGYLKGNILHYSFYTIDSHIKQIQYFTDISSKALFQKNYKPNFIKLYLSPIATFIDGYFLKLGFLDGKYGFEICKNSAWATKLKYHKLKALYKSKMNKTFVHDKLGAFNLGSNTMNGNLWVNNSSEISFSVRGSIDKPNEEQIIFLLNFTEEVSKLQDKITTKFKSVYKEAGLDNSFSSWNERFKIINADVMIYFENKAYWNITFQDSKKPYTKFTLYIEGQKFTDFEYHPIES